MSHDVAEPASPSPQKPPAGGKPAEKLVPFLIRRSWLVATAVAVIMVLLAMMGVGLSTTNSAFAPTYWVCLVPVYGMLCVGTAWLRRAPGGSVDRVAVTRQVFHWLGIGVALGFDFFVRETGQETGIASGLNALMVLALGCYLAGIHLEWLFVPVGLLLTLTLIVVAKADQYLWLLFIIGGLTVVVLLVLQRVLGAGETRKVPVQA